MDVVAKAELIQRPPTEEVITKDELLTLLKSKSSPNHYIGLEISGKLHLGSLILTGFKLNDFIKAGVKTNVFLADWHTYINNKLNNDWDLISNVSKYYEKAFTFFCPGVNIIHGTKLYEETDDYWKNFVLFSKQITLSRALRSLTIMGRTEKDSLDFSQLLYPSMQSVDIKAMDLDIVHAGTDQRKIHMLVREVFPKLGWKVPVSIHHHLLPGLTDPNISTNSSIEQNSEDAKIFTKMSKSNPASSILIHDSNEEIAAKIKKAYCPSKVTQNNPILEIINYVIFHEFDEFILERPTKYGGNISYFSFNELKMDFENGRIHPMDLKMSVSMYLEKIVAPVRNYLENDYRNIFQL